MLRLRDLEPARYAAEVLPETAPLWAGRRDFSTYVAQITEIARCPYGRRYYRTVGLFDGGRLVASFKRYQRGAHVGKQRLRAVGIGAVFTPADYRGRGYATAMLASELDRARADGFDVAYLFSDIGPSLYAQIGFEELPSREFSLASDRLPSLRLQPSPLCERDWAAVRRCFDLGERRRIAGLTRTPLVWQWIALRARHGSERAGGQETNLVVRRRGGAIAAYVLGERNPARDAYVLEEYGFADDRAGETIPALLRAAAGDLRRIVGWVPPSGARRWLSHVQGRRRRRAIAMAAPLSARGVAFVRALSPATDGDPFWRDDHV